MDPNNPEFSHHFGDLGDDPRFQLFLQRLGNTSLQNYSQQTPPEIPLENNSQQHQSPSIHQGSNSQYDFDDFEENVPETPPPILPTNQNQPHARATRIWSVAEDEALIGLYMQFSEDATVGTNQKASVLWRKVSVAYDKAQAEKPHILPPRPVKSLENRWRRMATDLLQWSSCYDEAGKTTGSGFNEVDRINNASKLFYISSKPTPHNFTCHHGWEMVKNDPKWRSKLRWALSKEDRVACDDDVEGASSGSGKRPRNEGESDGPSTGFSSGGLTRPDGVKKAKAKRTGKSLASETAIFSISEQLKANNENREREAILRQQKLELEREKEKRKQKQVELQEKKMNFDMLQALMGKNSPLTPAEEAYKEQLFALVYGGGNN